jgi:hypothetical protein
LLTIVRDADDVVRAEECLALRSSEILPGFSRRWSGPVKFHWVPHARLDAAHHDPVLGAMMTLPQQPATTHDPLHLVVVVALIYLTAGQVPELRLLDNSKSLAVNLGRSAGSSVFDAICVFETVGGKRVPYDVSTH